MAKKLAEAVQPVLQPTINAAALLRDIKSEDLAPQIAMAEAKLREAKNELQSLYSLQRVVLIREGRFTRKKDRRTEDKEKRNQQDQLILDLLEEALQNNLSAMNTQELSRKVGIGLAETKLALEQNPDLFDQVQPGVWTNIREPNKDGIDELDEEDDS